MMRMNTHNDDQLRNVAAEVARLVNIVAELNQRPVLEQLICVLERIAEVQPEAQSLLDASLLSAIRTRRAH